jgi:hypothetical protein
MTRWNAAPRIGAVLCASCLLGCDKQVELTFVNLTGDSLDVHLTSPEEGREYLGVIAPMGKLRHGLEIDKDDLPATVTWSAGPHRGRFPVTEETQEELWIEISPLGEPRGTAEGPGRG